MADHDLREKVNALVEKIREPGSGGTHWREAARAEVDIVLLEEHLKGLQSVSSGLNLATSAWISTQERLAKHTKALVFWTKVLAFATLAYAVFAGIVLSLQLR